MRRKKLVADITKEGGAAAESWHLGSVMESGSAPSPMTLNTKCSALVVVNGHCVSRTKVHVSSRTEKQEPMTGDVSFNKSLPYFRRVGNPRTSAYISLDRTILHGHH